MLIYEFIAKDSYALKILNFSVKYLSQYEEKKIHLSLPYNSHYSFVGHSYTGYGIRVQNSLWLEPILVF